MLVTRLAFQPMPFSATCGWRARRFACRLSKDRLMSTFRPSFATGPPCSMITGSLKRTAWVTRQMKWSMNCGPPWRRTCGPIDAHPPLVNSGHAGGSQRGEPSVPPLRQATRVTPFHSPPSSRETESAGRGAHTPICPSFRKEPSAPRHMIFWVASLLFMESDYSLLFILHLSDSSLAMASERSNRFADPLRR